MASPFVVSRGLSDQQSTLTVTECMAQIRQWIGGELPLDYSGLHLINEAGHFFASMHPWKWLTDREASLPLRGSVTVTGGSLSADGYTLTATGAFADYWRVEGDVFEVTGGTNVTNGFYRVLPNPAGETAANVIALEDDPSYQLGTGSAVTGTIHTSSIPLPADFRELIAIHPASGFANQIILTTYEDLLQKKASNMSGASGYYAAITHAMDFPGTGRPTNSVSGETDTVQGSGAGPKQTLEIVPQPSTNTLDAYKMYYRAGWTSMDTDHDKLRMPSYCQSLYLEVLRVFCQSRFGGGDLSQGLALVMQGPLLAVCASRDGAIQPEYGMLQGGAAERAITMRPFQDFNPVDAPS